MPHPNPTSRNYEPFTMSGTRIRSDDKQEERILLASAFQGVENGNFNDDALQTRVYQDKSVTLIKLADEVINEIQQGKGIAVAARQDFEAVAGQTVFPINFNFVPGSREVLWFRQGSLQRLGGAGIGDYEEISTSELQVNTPASNGERFTAIKLGIAGGTPATNEEVVASAGQSVVNLPFSYNVGSGELLVFRNGVKQRIARHYSETTSTQISFSNPLSINDSLEFLVYEGANSDADLTSRRVSNEALAQTFLNWMSQTPSFEDLFFDTMASPDKQDVSGDALHSAVSESFGGDGLTYIAKLNLTRTGRKVRVLWEDNGIGTLTIQVSTDGINFESIMFKDRDVILPLPGTTFEIRIGFAGGAVVRNLGVKISPIQ